MKTFTIVARGKTFYDVKLSIAEAFSRIKPENTSGHDQNEDGSLCFGSKGEYETKAEE